MNFIKNLTKKKYFYVIFFFCLIVVFAFMLHLVIQKDIQSGKPTDDFPRATAQVINAPNSYALTQDGVTKEYYSNILIHVEINENEAYLPIPTDCAPYYHWSDFRDFYLKKLDAYQE